MLPDGDHYEAYYADKLWNLLPAVYRAEDGDDFDRPGPLREMVNRIGGQAAILRRSIDRLWDDQSIETCDAWLIPYIADLLATNLVANQDSRGQRRDVAKTIYYRRRKGTVALLEELAADVTGWSVRVVEFFRRLGRTRDAFDPAIGLPSAEADPAAAGRLQRAEGLVGSLTHTPLGGWADLRDAYGAQKAHTAFDEFHHTADFRLGIGQVGWHDIPRLGVFVCRLRTFGVSQATPVEYKDCPGQYTCDPTGREIPLFATGERAYGAAWVSPQEWQLPTPISRGLFRLALPDLYALPDPVTGALAPRALAVFDQGGNLVPVEQITADPAVTAAAFFVDPERGRLIKRGQAPSGPPLVAYHYGFSSRIGAGPYDRRQNGEKDRAPLPGQVVTGGGPALDAALAAVAATDTRVIGDSLTYDQMRDVADIDDLTLAARNKKRPLIRLPAATPAWTFTGSGPESKLALTGLFISAGDLILGGQFDRVTLTCCTLDPGTANRGAGTGTFGTAADGRDLSPTHLWIEGQVNELVIERCILGPVRTRRGGVIGQDLTVSDSIVQAVPPDDEGLFAAARLPDPADLAVRLRDARDPLSAFIRAGLPAADQARLDAFDIDKPMTKVLRQNLTNALNALVNGPALFDPARFAFVLLTPAAQRQIALNPTGSDLAHLNRQLLAEAYPLALTNLALAAPSGGAVLTRCTVLGPAYLHRLTASECILNDVTRVEDAQAGCVRFSAWATGSVLPRQYESVEIAPAAPLFTSRDFGQSGYAQLLGTVDTAILAGLLGATISAGAQNGSEVGAFGREGNTIKERSLRIKYEEFMPLGLTPVIIHTT